MSAMTIGSVKAGMVGWEGTHDVGVRPSGIHPLASVGGPPENRNWMVGDATEAPRIASSALVHAFCTIDASMGGETPTTIGERTFLQARVHVGEAAVIGDDCELCAGVVICGHVEIGDGVRIGGNSWVKPRVKIGAGAIIGGGAVVTKDVPAHEVWAGSPAKYLKDAWTHPGRPWPLAEIVAHVDAQCVDSFLQQYRVALADGDMELATSLACKACDVALRVGRVVA